MSNPYVQLPASSQNRYLKPTCYMDSAGLFIVPVLFSILSAGNTLIDLSL